MPVPRRPAARLRVEPLEPRLTPADLGPARVLVTLAGPSLDSQYMATVRQAPAVAAVSRVADGLFQADLAPGASVADAVAAVGRLPNVVAAQPDYVLAPAAVTPNDPGYPGMWQYPATDAPAAWGVTTGTGRTIVAVIDTGVDVTHPDLAPNILRNTGEIPGNGRDDDGDGYVDDVTGWNFAGNNPDVSDDAGHGTHAAGIVAAAGDNGQGVAGVNWHARILPVKFASGSAGGFTSDAVRAIDYSVARGARVINASWGGAPYDAALAAAVGRARAAGVIVVAAAGNYSTNTDTTPFYPAGYAAQSDNVVAVAATDSGDRLAGFSNFGATSVLVAAPGVNINSTLPGGRYGTKSGTSMAAPFVAGAVSLLWDAHPDWSYRQVIDKLRTSVDALPTLAGRVASGGRLDLGKLLDAPASAPAPAPVPPTVPAPVPTPTPAPVGTRVAEAVIGGPRAGTVDRAWVRFTAAVDPAAVRAGSSLATPLGPVQPSAVTPVAGTGNTQFTLLLPRAYTAAGTYTLTVAAPAAAERFSQTLSVGGTPTVPPAAPAPVPPTVPVPVPAARQTVAAAGLPVPIRDGRTTRVELYVPTAATVRDVGVQLTARHPRVSDLSVRLTAPDGRRFTLFNRRGGGGADLNGTLFTDAAVQSLSGAAAPFGGAVRPEQPLAALNGANARGLWVIEIFDLAAGATGTLSGVTLSYTTGPAQSVAWAAQEVPATVVAATDSPSSPRAAVLPTAAAEAGRPDAVASPTAVRPTPAPRPADLTAWLVGRLQTRLDPAAGRV